MKHEINEICAGCSMKCKQPAPVSIVKCPKYQKAPKQLTIFDRGMKKHAAR